MRKPVLAIVGRPNVGKSSLFNRLVGKRCAIVDEAEGTTRDRLYGEGVWKDLCYQVMDTGGMDEKSSDHFKTQIIDNVRLAIDEADVVLLVVDGRVGLTTQDERVAKLLHRAGKRVVVAVNKIEDPKHEPLVTPFFSLGFSEIVAISATHALNLNELLERLWAGVKLPQISVKQLPKIAIVGRPNVGKSTFLNALLGQERAVVSERAGTTRDAVTALLNVSGKEYELIDTAGLRRKKSEKDVVDKFAALRTRAAIEVADVVLLMMDAESGLTEQEKRLAKEIEEAGRPCILLCNKWDQIKGYRMEHCIQGIRETTPFLAHIPLLFISAKTGRNLEKVFPTIDEVLAESMRRLTTSELNKFLMKAMQLNHPPMLQGRRLRIYYATQVDIRPPRFLLFVNNPALMAESYKKYLIGAFRSHFGFQGIPLLFHLKGKGVSSSDHDDRVHQGQELDNVANHSNDHYHLRTLDHSVDDH